jgi:hypothetical protein
MSWKIGRTRTGPARRVLVAAAACAAGLLHAPEVRGQDELQDLVRNSQFVFRGTIRQVGSATLPGIRVSDQTAVVTVDEVLKAPARLGDYTGRTITVQLRQPVAADHALVFFTTSWLYGTGLAVREVGRLDAQPAALRLRIADAEKKMADDKLQARIRNAELVVVGRVTALRDLNPGRAPLSEHDPLWRRASVTIQSVEKGTPAGATVSVLFPASNDVMWYRSPRFKVGQEGIWILDRDVAKQFGVEGFTALDPLDFHPKAELERIRRLIR